MSHDCMDVFSPGLLYPVRNFCMVVNICVSFVYVIIIYIFYEILPYFNVRCVSKAGSVVVIGCHAVSFIM